MKVKHHLPQAIGRHHPFVRTCNHRSMSTQSMGEFDAHMSESTQAYNTYLFSEFISQFISGE